MKIRRGGLLREVENAFIFYLGARRRLRSIKQMRGGALVTIASFSPPMTARIDPGSVSGSDQSTTGTPSSKAIATGNATLFVTGGVGPYTYVWTVTNPTGGSPTPSTPNMASTRFVVTVPIGQTYSANIVGTVTDSLGSTAFAVGSATFTYTDNS